MDATTAMYVSQGIHGLAYGMVLFLVASGLTLIFGMMGILNIAHAAFFMLSAYFSYQVVVWTGSFWLALLLAPIATGLLGALVERFLLRKIHAFGHTAELILTVGIMFVIMGAVKVFWGTETLFVSVPKVPGGARKHRRHGLPHLSALHHRPDRPGSGFSGPDPLQDAVGHGGACSRFRCGYGECPGDQCAPPLHVCFRGGLLAGRGWPGWPSPPF